MEEIRTVTVLWGSVKVAFHQLDLQHFRTGKWHCSNDIWNAHFDSSQMYERDALTLKYQNYSGHSGKPHDKTSSNNRNPLSSSTTRRSQERTGKTKQKTAPEKPFRSEQRLPTHDWHSRDATTSSTRKKALSHLQRMSMLDTSRLIREYWKDSTSVTRKPSYILRTNSTIGPKQDYSGVSKALSGLIIWTLIHSSQVLLTS